MSGKHRRKVDRGNDDVDGERAISGGRCQLTFARQLDEADDCRERGVLDQLNEEADRGRYGDAYRLRHDDVAQLFDEAEAERAACFPLLARDRDETSPPDLAKERARIDRKGNRCGDPRRDLVVGDDRQPEEEYEQPGEQRNALDDCDVAGADDAQRPPGRNPEQRHEDTDDAAAEERERGQCQCPAGSEHEVVEVDECKFSDHRRAKATCPMARSAILNMSARPR